MFNRSEPVLGLCNATLYIADDYGDNQATMRCQLDPGHEGMHSEGYENEDRGQRVSVAWAKDEREICAGCGKNEDDWDDNHVEEDCDGADDDEEAAETAFDELRASTPRDIGED